VKRLIEYPLKDGSSVLVEMDEGAEGAWCDEAAGENQPRCHRAHGAIPQLARAASNSRGRIWREAQGRSWRFYCLGCDGSQLQGDPHIEALQLGIPMWQALEGPACDRPHFPRMLR
jgi:hypothetical protein